MPKRSSVTTGPSILEKATADPKKRSFPSGFFQMKMLRSEWPEVMVPFAGEKIDNRGRIKDEKTRTKIRELFEGLVAWTRRTKLEEEVTKTLAA